MNICKDTVIGGRYRVVGKIGVGGMAVVYRAKDEKLGRDVTVKILKEDYANDDRFKEKFRSEAYAVAKLSHHNIVNVYDSGEEGDICYIVMEYVNGSTLKDVIDSSAPLGSVTVLSIASQIASALKHAHKNHIIHRDIKPQNILVSSDGTVKVTDFGIARSVSEDTLTAKNDSLGSVYYLSPEQARGGYVDERSDIYSLGITMFEMITGEVPFDGKNAVAIAVKHMNEELPDIEDINPDADELLQRIIYKATNKKADERYPNITSMLDDIKHALSDIARGMKYDPDDDYEDEDDGYDDGYDDGDGIDVIPFEKEKKDGYYGIEDFEREEAERKTVIAAVITALIIIVIITVLGYLTFFAGEKVEVPSLVGMSLEDAKLEAAGKNLNIVIDEEEYNDSYGRGIVYEQSKDAGSKVKENSEIKISVSLGKNSGEMPDLLYSTEKEALKMVKALVGADAKVERVFDETIPEGLVCRQSPEKGTSVTKNTSFVLTISKGPEVATTTVPRITGMTIDQAEATLEAAGLSIGTIGRVESSSAPKDTVISQEISSGETVDKDTRINIVVSKGVLVYIPVEGEDTGETPTGTETPESGVPVIGGDESEDNNESGTITFKVELPSDAAGDVSVKIIKIENGNELSEVYDEIVYEDDFPLRVPVTGKGNAEVQLYINDSYEWSQYVNFSEGGN